MARLTPPVTRTWPLERSVAVCSARGEIMLPVVDQVAPVVGEITVESVVVAVTEPPPEADTELTCGEEALPPTLTVTVIGG